MIEEILEIRRDLTELGPSLKKPLSHLQELIIANMKSLTYPPSPNRNKRQKKLREKSQDSSSNSSMDSCWADQCDTDSEKPCDGNDTTLDASLDGADVY
jgi:hypothetical protein